jgi:hypothetical protein
LPVNAFSHQRLTLAGLHLGDVALVQGDAPHQLNVEVPLADRAQGGFANGGERLRQQMVEALAVGVPFFEPVGLLAQLGVGHRLEVVFQRADLTGQRLQLPHHPAFTGAQNPLEDRHVLNSLISMSPATTGTNSPVIVSAGRQCGDPLGEDSPIALRHRVRHDRVTGCRHRR